VPDFLLATAAAAAAAAGNPAFSQAYNRALLSRTLRMTNTQGFAVRLPAPVMECSTTYQSTVPTMFFGALMASTARFVFAHVGRAVLMCPEPRSGLTEWRMFPQGSEVVDCCSGSDEVDASGATHQLGSYFDAWRRGYLASKGTNLANDTRVMSVLCRSCTQRMETILEQIAVPARPGGPVTCGADASCSVQAAFAAATAVGGELVAPFSRGALRCVGFLCS
jgi:hypothetical protein